MLRIIDTAAPCVKSQRIELHARGYDPLRGYTLHPFEFDVHWVRATQSRDELRHDDALVAGFASGLCEDHSGFDSFKALLGERFERKCEELRLTPQSDLVLVVRTTVWDIPVLALDARLPLPCDASDHARIDMARRRNELAAEAARPMRAWLDIPSGWGVFESDRVGRHEDAYTVSDGIVPLQRREVASLSVWDSRKGLAQEQDLQDIERHLRSMLLREWVEPGASGD